MASLSKQLERKRREIPWLLVLSAVMFWICLGFSAWTWGALGRIPESGPVIEANARNESLLALSYMKTGQWVTSLLRQPELGTAGIQVDYATTLPQVLVEPTSAVQQVLTSKESLRARLLTWAHYATAPLFVLWVLFTIFRPRTRRTFTRTI